LVETISYTLRHRNTLARASNETVVGKNGKNTDFQPINRYISKTIEDRHIVTMED